LQKQYEIVAIYPFLVTDFASWDNWIFKIENFGNFSIPIWLQSKMLC
jgi:hypothetical protein